MKQHISTAEQGSIGHSESKCRRQLKRRPQPIAIFVAKAHEMASAATFWRKYCTN